jgi:regulator of RNase E activity RraA
MKFNICGYSIEELKTRLYSAVISDILDELGYRYQSLDSELRPLDDSLVLIGRAFTAVAVEVYDIPQEPYKMQMKAVDSVKEGEIFIVTTGKNKSSAFWGELLSTACNARGGVGALVDGLSRDSKKIREMKFPVFTRGNKPTDSKGRLDVINYQVPIEISGVRIEPGDIIFGDIDGIVVIPKVIENMVIQKAIEKAAGENLVRNALKEGMLCTEAFKTFGIL